MVTADDKNVTAGRDILSHHQKLLLHPVSIVCYGNCPIARNLSCVLHGVCYGFEILQKCEPQHLFQFPPGLELIIYDNTFHLHVRSLACQLISCAFLHEIVFRSLIKNKMEAENSITLTIYMYIPVKTYL